MIKNHRREDSCLGCLAQISFYIIVIGGSLFIIGLFLQVIANIV
jgi:hypothetical protein